MDGWEESEKRAERRIKREAEVIANRLATSKITEASHKRMMDYENKLIKQRRMETILTRSLGSGGGVGGNIFNMLQNIGQAKYAGHQRLTELNKKGLDMSSAELKERNMLDSGFNKPTNKMFQKLDQTFEKHFGGDSKWNKAFGGHGKMAAAGIGMGGVGIGAALGKAIIDSSPMFQQMLKLLKFGIMMVLRPIGDFFGFVMRPIMIMLLRKFIIPWYSKMYPQMMKWGTDIGTKLAGALSALADGDIAGAFAAIWGEVDWGDTIWKVLKVAITPIAIGDIIAGAMGSGDGTGFNVIGQEIKKRLDEMDWTKVQDSWNSIGTEFDNAVDGFAFVWSQSLTGFKTDLTDAANDIVNGLATGMNNISTFFSVAGTEASTWVKDKWDDMTSFFSDIGHDAGTWVQDRWNKITKFFSNIAGNVTNWINEKWDNFTDFFANVLGNVWYTLGSYWNSFVSFFASIGNTVGYLGNLIGIKAAKGYDGIVNQPTLMMVGEAGAEHVKVTPNNQLHNEQGGGGTSITINIDNMSASQQDLNSLKTTILSVIQEANTRRGRI